MNPPEITNFVIERELGQGGMARVYLACQVLLSRQVALKVLLPEYSNIDFRDAFLHEGKVIAQLEHPNIVKVYDIGITDDSVFYMAMEYLAGGSLRDKLRIQHFSPDEVQSVLIQVGEGLEHAHQRGFIHRDIKPENILFRNDGVAILTDFGIAKLQDTTGEMTRMGFTVGTAHYMSPEQASTGKLDSRSDIYSLALTIFEMLSGKKVCQADSLIQAIHQHSVLPPPELPVQYRYFQPVLHKALAKEPNARYATVREFIDAFKVVQNQYHHVDELPIMENSDDTVIFIPGQLLEKSRVADIATESRGGSYTTVAVTQQIPINTDADQTEWWRHPLFLVGLSGTILIGVVCFFLLWPRSPSVTQVLPSLSHPATLDTPIFGQPSQTPQISETDSQSLPTGTALQPSNADNHSDITIGMELEVVTDAGDPLKLREGPGTSYSFIASLPTGTRVRVISDKTHPEMIESKDGSQRYGAWVKVSTLGKTGFVYDFYLKQPSATSQSFENTFVVRKGGATIYATATNTATILQRLTDGKTVVALDEQLVKGTFNGASGNWLQVRSDKINGFIFDRHIFPLKKAGATRVAFKPGAISAEINGSVSAGGTRRYVLGAMQWQSMRVIPLQSANDIVLFAYSKDNVVLASDVPGFTATLPTTQDYYVTVFGNAAGNHNFRYKVEIQ